MLQNAWGREKVSDRSMQVGDSYRAQYLECHPSGFVEKHGTLWGQPIEGQK
jgi:hypothetical protein